MSLIKFLLALLLLCLVSQAPFAQGKISQSILDAAINTKGNTFVGRRPIARIELDTLIVWSNLEDSVRLLLGKARLSQLFDHSQLGDTTYWTDKELNNRILVQNRMEDVDVDYVIRKFNLTDKNQIKEIKRRVSQFNGTDAQDKDIWYFSKPVFDDSGKFAIIQWDNGHSYLGGGGGIKLYQLNGEEWQYLGNIAMWKY